MPLLSIRVGFGYDEDSGAFEQERIVTVPRPPAPDTRARQGGGGDRATDASESGIGADGGEGEVYRDAAMYVVEQWGSMPRSVVFALRWYNPAGELLLTSVHSVQQGWQSTWQRRSMPLEVIRGGGVGEWRVEMVRVVWWDGVSKDLFSDEAHPEEQLVLGTLVASARFFLGFEDPPKGSGDAPGAGLSVEVAKTFWEVQSVIRQSAYAKHASCRDIRVRPDLCVCTLPHKPV
ncbi:hypothetical protein T484DRAFT_3479924 [Baffinella frigidus]|nr:hypothetical protein T484DRAFT_3479924 [Cryptophyta sp. CCMP2293]